MRDLRRPAWIEKSGVRGEVFVFVCRSIEWKRTQSQQCVMPRESEALQTLQSCFFIAASLRFPQRRMNKTA
jgi:hypothetical protein